MGRWINALKRQEESELYPTEPTKPSSVGSVGATSASSRCEGRDLHATSSCRYTDEDLERELISAAMKACDFWGDDAAARTEMVADILRTPHSLRLGLLEHLLACYGKSKG
jgi:hypothetical protein